MFSSRLDFKGSVVGMLLGDADLCKEKGTKASYYLTMKEKKTFELDNAKKNLVLPNYNTDFELDKQKQTLELDYVLYKQEVLSYLTKCKIVEVRDVGWKKMPFRTTCGKDYIMLENPIKKVTYATPYVTLVTRTHPMYSKLHGHMYHEGRKSLDEHSVKCISLRGMAILFQDKGYFEEETEIPCLRLPHLNFVEKGVFTRILQKKFNLQWRIDGSNIRLRKKDIEVFLNSISAYLHPSKTKSNNEKRTEPRVIH